MNWGAGHRNITKYVHCTQPVHLMCAKLRRSTRRSSRRGPRAPRASTYGRGARRRGMEIFTSARASSGQQATHKSTLALEHWGLQGHIAGSDEVAKGAVRCTGAWSAPRSPAPPPRAAEHRSGAPQLLLRPRGPSQPPPPPLHRRRATARFPAAKTPAPRWRRLLLPCLRARGRRQCRVRFRGHCGACFCGFDLRVW